MFIKSLKLLNFQKHSDLQINFINGVNVLYGKSDAGKSCIRRAIEWITQNENIDGIRKTNSKQTSVTIVLDNDIEIERVRSQSINRYIIRHGKDEQVFDAIGKSIPDEVKEVLTIYPIEVDGEEIYLNSHPQLSLPFLFDKSPSFRMKLFNRLTGNDVLDKLFGEFNKDIFRIKRDKKEETKRFEDREVELKNKKIEMEKAQALYARLEKRIEKLNVVFKKYSKLLELKELIESNIKDKAETTKILKNMNFPQVEAMKELKEQIDQFDKLSTHKNSLEKINFSINRVTDQLKDYKPVEVNYGDLQGKIERFERIKDIYEKFTKNRQLLVDFKKKLKIIDMDIKCDYKNLDKYEVCKDCDGRGVKFNEK